MSGIKILLAEGDQRIATELREILLQRHYAVDIASDGSMGKQLFHSQSYGLVLVNFHLPDIDGCELCRYIREKNEHIPVLMLASREQDYSDPYFRTIFPKVVRLMRDTSILVLVGYSLPEDDALKALFDRFLLRVHCGNVAAEVKPTPRAVSTRASARSLSAMRSQLNVRGRSSGPRAGRPGAGRPAGGAAPAGRVS